MNQSADNSPTADDTLAPVTESEAQDQAPDPEYSSREDTSDSEEDLPSDEYSGDEEGDEEKVDEDRIYEEVCRVPGPFFHEWNRQ
jgi:hypothetical protein